MKNLRGLCHQYEQSVVEYKHLMRLGGLISYFDLTNGEHLISRNKEMIRKYYFSIRVGHFEL